MAKEQMWIKITPIFPLPSIMQQESESLWFNQKFQMNRDWNLRPQINYFHQKDVTATIQKAKSLD
jgi:hypothetical protein